ncbi:hypothetical protein [Mycobacterium terramassiliense]|uniref:Secreted protein n=1 Tax=Mycobacterium terramassiliense TaxID=1841859 RepID=A0A2U3N7S7_9MYCO|nr:hypothetical protein [Mycobacterium terramassiliense]SPM27573.1 hypothetical protein BN1232_02054 [Mycobacterium terramassiliense]
MRGTLLALGGLTLAAFALAPAPRAAALPPPGFPDLNKFTAVPVDGYATTPPQGGGPRISFAATPTLVCDFYGGPAPVPQPSQDIKCSGDIPGMDDVLFPGGGHPRPGDCVVGAVNFKGPGYELSRMTYGGCGGNPPPLPSGVKALGPGQKLSYLNVTCAVGADNVVACLDTTSGDHGFVLDPSGSWAF